MKKKLIAIYMWICVLPVILFGGSMIVCSFLSEAELSGKLAGIGDGSFHGVFLFPEKLSFAQYLNAFWNHSDFWFYFWNSVLISGAILLGTLVVSIPAAFALLQMKGRVKRMLLTFVILLMLVPFQVFLAPQMMVLSSFGLLNTKASVILPGIFTMLGVYLLYQFMHKVPQESLEAAKLDGAGTVTILHSIVLPQIKEGISALVILNLIDTWNMVEQPLFYIENAFKRPLSVILSESGQLASENVFAGCVVFMIPMVLIFLLCRRSLIAGIQEAVVK